MTNNLSYSTIVGTIILYNPLDDTFDNIQSYITELDMLIIVDNSDIHNVKLINKIKNQFDKIIYINNFENLGIATALNIACNKAIELGYQWILTMDQDSSFVNFNEYLRCITKITDKQVVSIISPNSNMPPGISKNCEMSEKTLTITSGAFLNLTHFEKVGKFTDKLFIDEVDHDYCLRSIEKKLKVLQFFNIPLIHTIGEKSNYKKKVITQHNPIRMYYITRNSFYIVSRFKKSFPERYSYKKTFYKNIYKTFFKILKQEDYKLLKLKYVCLGIIDFLRGKYGRV